MPKRPDYPWWRQLPTPLYGRKMKKGYPRTHVTLNSAGTESNMRSSQCILTLRLPHEDYRIPPNHTEESRSPWIAQPHAHRRLRPPHPSSQRIVLRLHASNGIVPKTES